jgi:hypothetical protein
MRRMALGCVLTFAAFVLMTSPASAVPGSPQVASVLSAADQEFLASLATPAPMLAAKRPIEGKAMCTAVCGVDHPLVCPPGTTTCSAVDADCAVGVRGYIICDSVKTKCPAVCSSPN